MEKIYFVMPAFNEEDNIQQTIEQWYDVVKKVNEMPDCNAKLVIANDGSTDDTYNKMTAIKAERQLTLLEIKNKPNEGHGQTLLFLYNYALGQEADYVFQTDSDGQTDPKEFWTMMNLRHDYDIQIGNRSHRKDGAGRIIVAKTLRLIVWLLLHVWVKDANTPFRLIRGNKLKAIVDIMPPKFFLCNVAIAAISKKWNYRMRFQDISFSPRQKGVNSINLKRIIHIGWSALKEFRKLNNILRHHKP